jgi:hypothetical protein
VYCKTEPSVELGLDVFLPTVEGFLTSVLDRYSSEMSDSTQRIKKSL